MWVALGWSRLKEHFAEVWRGWEVKTEICRDNQGGELRMGGRMEGCPWEEKAAPCSST